MICSKKIAFFSPDSKDTFEEQFISCINGLRIFIKKYLYLPKNILMINCFIKSESPSEYIFRRYEVLSKFEEFFNNSMPAVSVIAQQPGNFKITLEVHYAADDSKMTITRKIKSEIPYVILENNSCKELYAAGIMSKQFDQSTDFQSQRAFDILEDILLAENMNLSNIQRQWNYIPDIINTCHSDDTTLQNYQIFNDIRALYYGKHHWENGYPAATGIGISSGNVMISVLASAGESTALALSNPHQTNAHQYSAEVLVGDSLNKKIKSPPLFERAKALFSDCACSILISGTAAIRGQLSVEDNAVNQTEITIQNIASLISKDNLEQLPIEFHPLIFSENTQKSLTLDYARVYYRFDEDLEAVRECCSRHFPDGKTLFLKADICRDDLLIEIECSYSIG